MTSKQALRCCERLIMMREKKRPEVRWGANEAKVDKDVKRKGDDCFGIVAIHARLISHAASCRVSNEPLFFSVAKLHNDKNDAGCRVLRHPCSRPRPRAPRRSEVLHCPARRRPPPRFAHPRCARSLLRCRCRAGESSCPKLQTTDRRSNLSFALLLTRDYDVSGAASPMARSYVIRSVGRIDYRAHKNKDSIV